MLRRLFEENVCNFSVDVVDLMDAELKNDLNQIYKVFHGFIPLPIAVLGLILSIIYIITVINAIQKQRVSRKCYVLLVNRTIGDVLTCLIVIGMAIYTMCVEIVSREAMQIIDCFIISAFWSAMISYVALSFIKFYGVWRPLNYRRYITMRRCILLAVVSWVVFLIMGAYGLSVMLAVIDPRLHAWTNCKRETCIRYMYKIRNTFMIIAYVFTLFCFGLTVVLIKRSFRFVSSFHQSSSNIKPEGDNSTKPRSLRQRFPLWKLAVNVGTFAFFNLFYVIWAVVLAVNTDKCFFRRRFNLMIFLLGCVRVSLLTRIVIDPILALLTDFQIRRSFNSLTSWTSSIQPTDSKRRPFARRSQVSDDNSSEGNTNRVHPYETQVTDLPDRPSITSLNSKESPVYNHTSSVKSNGTQKVRITNRPATINRISDKKI